MMESTDISKIVGLIMENPEILNKIRSLVEESEKEKTEELPTAEQTVAEPSEDIDQKIAEEAPVVAVAKKDLHDSDKRRRNELLCALKPYVSHERAKAIDTILSVVEVWELLKARPR